MSEEEVQELEEWAEETEKAWEEVEAELAEDEENSPVALYVAKALLTRGSHFIYPGETVELDHMTAQTLLIKGKVRPAGKEA